MGMHSEVGKGELGPYIRRKDNSCSKKGYTSPLNSLPSFKNQAGCREPLGRTSRPPDTRDLYITIYRAPGAESRNNYKKKIS
jgi:hypothetical protein